MLETMSLEIRDTPSPHHDSRREGGAISLIILHYTGTRTAQEAADVYLGRVSDPAGRVAPHYMIDRDGTVYRFVEESRRAWHAGKSFWRGERDMNSVSVGIELVNPGHDGGCPPFPEPQMAALVKVCQDIMGRHGIPPHGVLGHSDIAPGRKQDPGPALDWCALAGQGVGIWPQGKAAEGVTMSLEDFQARLVRYGYDPDISDEARRAAFALHFGPEEGHSTLAQRLRELFRIEGLPFP